MVKKNRADLTVTDVEFLQAVRYVAENVDEYPDSEGSVVRKPSLRTVLEEEWQTTTEWNKNKIDYRMCESDRGTRSSRQWDVQGGLGLVKMHDAEMTVGEGWSGRGVELTEKGRKKLAQAEERMNLSRSGESGGVEELDSSTRDLELRLEKLEEEIETLRSENKELRAENEELQEIVQTFQEEEYGAIDDGMGEQIDMMFNEVLAQARLAQLVFGIDREPFTTDKRPSDEVVIGARESVASVLSDVRGDSSGDVSSGGDGKVTLEEAVSDSSSE